MEALHEQQQPDADLGGLPGELDYAATATSNRDGGAAAAPGPLSRGLTPTARRDEVQRLFSSVLVVRHDLSLPYAAPVIIMNQEESNIHAVLERHLRREYLLGPEKFWKLVRAELGADTWRPRVQGAQLKALQGARLPEYKHELDDIQRVAEEVKDCLLPDSSPEALMQDLRATIAQIQLWWRTRNVKADGSFKRAGTTSLFQAHASKRRAISLGGILDQQLLHLADAGDQQDVLNDPAATTAALTAAAAAAASAGFMDLHAGGITGALLLPAVSAGQSAAAAAAAGAPPGSAAAAAVAAAAAAGGGGGGAGGLDAGLLGAAAAFNHPAAAAGSNPLSPFLASPGSLLVLDVGGTVFRTTLNTLLSVQDSLFWQVCYGQAAPGVMQRLPGGEVFIDRSGEVFSYVLEYLRACACSDITFPVPNDARELQALAREAHFYQLGDLVHHIQHAAIEPHPSTRTFFDMAYLETGFRPIEGPAAMRGMERAKLVMMQQLNHIIHAKGREGFAVQEVVPGMAHREGAAGQAEHNLYYNVLLKKVVPLLPDDMTGGGDDGDDDNDEQQEEEERDELQQHQQQQQQAGLQRQQQ